MGLLFPCLCNSQCTQPGHVSICKAYYKGGPQVGWRGLERIRFCFPGKCSRSTQYGLDKARQQSQCLYAGCELYCRRYILHRVPRIGPHKLRMCKSLAFWAASSKMTSIAQALREQRRRTQGQEKGPRSQVWEKDHENLSPPHLVPYKGTPGHMSIMEPRKVHLPWEMPPGAHLLHLLLHRKGSGASCEGVSRHTGEQARRCQSAEPPLGS